MTTLRITPEGQGQYAKLNETFDENEETWEVNTTTPNFKIPVGNTNSRERSQSLAWANRPKNKTDGGKRSRVNRGKNIRKNRHTTRKNRNNRKA